MAYSLFFCSNLLDCIATRRLWKILTRTDLNVSMIPIDDLAGKGYSFYIDSVFGTKALKVTIATMALLTAGCTSFGSVDGVSNLWREVPVDQFQEEVTMQSDVLELVGPPSQLINLHDQTVFYYLARQSSDKSKILIVWNQANVENEYARAILFFETGGFCRKLHTVKEAIYR